MNAAVQAEALALGPVARLFDARPLVDVVSADLKRSTLTLHMDSDMPVPRGPQYLVPATEALAAAAQESQKPQAVYLQPPHGEVFVRWWFLGDDLDFEVYRTGYRATLYYRRASGDRSQPPNRYWGSQTLLDQRGREWKTALPEMVTDDFGSLVPVDGGVL